MQRNRALPKNGAILSVAGCHDCCHDNRYDNRHNNRNLIKLRGWRRNALSYGGSEDVSRKILDKAAMKQAFGRAGDPGAPKSGLQAEVAGRLLERLDGLKFDPTIIVDLGCGSGVQAKALSQRFGNARVVVAMDRSLPMLVRANTARGWLRKRFERAAGDADALPLAESSVDLLYSNLTLQRCEELPATLNGFRRVLKPGGLVLFSTLGPDTLIELSEAWKKTDGQQIVRPFADVQTIGDAMMRAGFGEPVLDTDWITTGHKQPQQLLDETETLGATCPGIDLQPGQAPPASIESLQRACEGARIDSGLYTSTWEVIYASAWGPEEGAPIRNIHGEEASVSVASIGRRER